MSNLKLTHDIIILSSDMNQFRMQKKVGLNMIFKKQNNYFHLKNSTQRNRTRQGVQAAEGKATKPSIKIRLGFIRKIEKCIQRNTKNFKTRKVDHCVLPTLTYTADS